PTVSSNRRGLTEPSSPATAPTMPGRASPASSRSLLLISVLCLLPQNCPQANAGFRGLSTPIFLNLNMVIAPPGSQIPKRFTSDMRLLLAREPPALLQCPRVVEKPFPPGRLPWPRTRHRIFL